MIQHLPPGLACDFLKATGRADHQLENLQNQFHRKFAEPNSQDLITKHMPKSHAQQDLAGILKCNSHQIAHKVVVQ